MLEEWKKQERRAGAKEKDILVDHRDDGIHSSRKSPSDYFLNWRKIIQHISVRFTLW
jgi:hypothetical protein